MSDIAPTTKSETPSPSGESVCVTSDTPSQAPAPEAKNDEATAPPSSHPTSDIPHPTFLDSLAEALTTTTPLADIAARHNLTIAQLSTLAKSPPLADKIAAISALHALHDAAIIREQIAKLRDIANTTDSPIEARRASTTIIRHSAIMARIAAGRNKRAPANLRSLSGSTTPLSENEARSGDYDSISQAADPQASDPTTQSSSSSPSLHPSVSTSLPSVAPSHRRSLTPIPLPPKPYSSPELLIEHQINQLRKHQPKTPHAIFNALYDNLDHPIKCITSLQTKLKNRIDASQILYHYNADYEDLGPASFDQEVLIPAPISPDLSRKPVLKHFAIKRYAFAREGATPIYYRIHLAKQDPVPGETADRWALSDIAIDSS